MRETDRHREGITGVRGQILTPQPQQELDHSGDLLLVGPTVSSDGGFHLCRRVFGNRHAGSCEGREDGASGLGEHDQGLGIDASKQGLEGRRVGGVLGDDHIQGSSEPCQALRQGKIPRQPDPAMVHDPQLRALPVDDTEPGEAATGIDT